MRAKAREISTRRARIQKPRPTVPKGELPPYIFVYGTLKRGEKFHSELYKAPGVKYVGEARIRGQLYRIRGADFPGAIRTSLPNRYVAGQLFFMEHPQKTLAVLDEFEGVEEGLFHRELVDLRINGKPSKAWAYFYARPVQQSDLLQI